MSLRASQMAKCTRRDNCMRSRLARASPSCQLSSVTPSDYYLCCSPRTDAVACSKRPQNHNNCRARRVHYNVIRCLGLWVSAGSADCEWVRIRITFRNKYVCLFDLIVGDGIAWHTNDRLAPPTPSTFTHELTTFFDANGVKRATYHTLSHTTSVNKYTK